MFRTRVRGCLLALLAWSAMVRAGPIDAYHVAGSFTDEKDETPLAGQAFLHPDIAMDAASSLGDRDSGGNDTSDTNDADDARHLLARACYGDACLPLPPHSVSAVPEPGGYALLAAGLALLAGRRRWGRQESLGFSQPSSTRLR